MGKKPIGGIFSVGVEEPYRWKDSVQGEAEIRIWVADGVANGLRPWFTKFAGVLHDRRWLGRSRSSTAGTTAMSVPAQRGAAGPGRPGLLAADGLVLRRAAGSAEGRGSRSGWYQALVEARIPFEMVHDRLLDAEHIGPVPDADPAQHRRAVRSAVPAAPRVR